MVPFFGYQQFLVHGVQVGHSLQNFNFTSGWFLLALRAQVAIIQLYKTTLMFKYAFTLVSHLVFLRGPIWFMNLEPLARHFVSWFALACGEFFICSSWTRGLLSNYSTIYGALLRRQITNTSFTRPTSDLLILENWHMSRYTWPRLIFASSVQNSEKALKEADGLSIPNVGIVDTNSQSHVPSIPIPGNDDSSSCLLFYNSIMSNFISLKKFSAVSSWFYNIRRPKRRVAFEQWVTRSLEPAARRPEGRWSLDQSLSTVLLYHSTSYWDTAGARAFGIESASVEFENYNHLASQLHDRWSLGRGTHKFLLGKWRYNFRTFLRSRVMSLGNFRFLRLKLFKIIPYFLRRNVFYRALIRSNKGFNPRLLGYIFRNFFYNLFSKFYTVPYAVRGLLNHFSRTGLIERFSDFSLPMARVQSHSNSDMFTRKTVQVQDPGMSAYLARMLHIIQLKQSMRKRRVVSRLFIKPRAFGFLGERRQWKFKNPGARNMGRKLYKFAKFAKLQSHLNGLRGLSKRAFKFNRLFLLMASGDQGDKKQLEQRFFRGLVGKYVLSSYGKLGLDLMPMLGFQNSLAPGSPGSQKNKTVVGVYPNVLWNETDTYYHTHELFGIFNNLNRQPKYIQYFLKYYRPSSLYFQKPRFCSRLGFLLVNLWLHTNTRKKH